MFKVQKSAEQDKALRSIRAAMKSDGLAQLRLVPAGERKSPGDVLEDMRLSSRWVHYFREFRDPYLHLTPEQYRALAERNSLHVRRIHTEGKAWDCKSRSAFFDFGSVTFVEWAQSLPESEKPAFVNDVLDRYRSVTAAGPGEEIPSSFIKWMSPLCSVKERRGDENALEQNRFWKRERLYAGEWHV